MTGKVRVLGGLVRDREEKKNNTQMGMSSVEREGTMNKVVKRVEEKERGEVGD